MADHRGAPNDRKRGGFLGVVRLLQELGRDLDLMITAGSIQRAREATEEADRRRELVAALHEALDDLPQLEGLLPDDPLPAEMVAKSPAETPAL